MPGDSCATRPTLNQRPVALRARWIVPVTSPPVADGWLTVAGGRIVALGSAPSPNAQRVDLGDAMILPGLINAHAHLEFSLLDAPLGKPGQSLPDWIRDVLSYRRFSNVDRGAAIAAGIEECARHGTAVIGEIATGDWQRSWYDRSASPHPHDTMASPPRLVLFHELIGFASGTVPFKVEEAMARLAEPPSPKHLPLKHAATDEAGWTMQLGISPHAPYTVHPDLLRQLVALAELRRCPLAMHLAESLEELELMKHGTGPMRDLLADAGVWQAGAIPRGTTPTDYLRMLTAGRSRVLAIHGNYFSADDIAVAASLRDCLTVVYCPRTHAYFGHRRYPLGEMLSAGVRVALGTDGRSSNPDLNVLNEVRYVAEHHGVPMESALRMATIDAAQALGLATQLGSLAPGKAAALTVLALPAAGDPMAPLHWLFDRRVNAMAWRSRIDSAQ